MSSYTKRGPFVDASPTGPYVDAAFFNSLETALAGSFRFIPTATGVAATDTANVTAAIIAAQAAGDDLYFTGTYQLNSGLTWNIARGSLVGVGLATLNFTALATGPALTVTGPANGHRSATFRLAGFQMLGPNTDASTVDGVYFNEPTTASVDQFTIEQCIVSGFRDGLTYGSNTWSIEHRKVFVTGCHRYGINLTVGTNAGEAPVFVGVTVSGTHNASNTGIGVYSAPTGGGVDAKFFGGSLDYNDQGYDINGGSVAFVGVHFEDASVATPMGRLSYTGGANPVNVDMTDCTFSPTETVRGLSTAGRPALFEVKAGSGTRVNLTVQGGFGGAFNTSTQFVVDSSGAGPWATVRGFNFDPGGTTNVPQYGDYLNLLANGTFESSTTVASGLGGWSIPTNGGYYTAVVHSGTQSLRLSSGTAFTATAFQQVAVIPRSVVSLSGYVASNSYTSGSSAFQVQFLAADRTTVISTVGLRTLTSTLSFTGVAQRLMVPQGAAYASVQLVATSLVGTVILDDAQLVQL